MTRSALFNDGHLHDLLFAYEKKLPEDIASLEGQRVLGASFSDLCAHFDERFRLLIPKLRLDSVYTLDPKDVQIQLSPHEASFYYDDSGPRCVQGHAFTLVVPFDGDPDLFKYRPNRGYLTTIEGSLNSERNALVLTEIRRDLDQAAVRTAFDQRLARIEEYLQTQRQQVGAWNAQLSALVTTKLEARKQTAANALNVAQSLGYPLRSRSDRPYVPPVTRKRITQLPAPRPAPYTPEPALEMRQYEEILQAVSSLSIMMERSPSAFSGMGEEQLRDHVLVILNGQFEGAAAGETFNKSGKTDILIREQGRNIFIAECKFWDGPKSLSDAIDQLLSYACWRDSKLAVVVFNRRKDFSAVLATIPDTAKLHPQCKRQVDYAAQGQFRFVFGQKDDPNRDLTVTIMAFDVPVADSDAPAGSIRQPPRARASPTPKFVADPGGGPPGHTAGRPARAPARRRARRPSSR